MSELWKQSAVDVVDLLRSGEISPVEAAQAAIARIEAVDHKTNALPIRCFDRAIERAQTLDLTREQQNPKSLCGLPIAVKDYNDVAGVRTTRGSPILENNVPEQSDLTVSVLEKNGANPIAKSNVPEWAGGHTFNPVNGLTCNPWNLSRSAGGSSGGSASALATGQVWLATGNDLGGSLRTPAAFNGVVGLRPSPGVVPRGHGNLTFDTLWVEGPMGRSVGDVALMLDAGCGLRTEDPLSFNHHCDSFSQAIKQHSLPGRVAFSTDLGIVPVAQDIRTITENAAADISRLGIDVSDDIPDFTGVLDAFHILRGVLLATLMGELVQQRGEEILSDIVKNVAVGFNVTSEQLLDAERVRWTLSGYMSAFFEHHDFLICPAASIAAFESEMPFITEIDGTACKTYIDWFAITFALTMTGCPVISLPCGFTDEGLPMGLQILAKPRHEDQLLGFAALLEEHFDIRDQLPIDPRDAS
jgi:amidase